MSDLFVPLSIRSRSRLVSFAYRHHWSYPWLTYGRAKRLARWLP